METLTDHLSRRGVGIESLTGVRRLIVTRAREQRQTLADLSRAAGRNHSYMHQFLYRRTPLVLPEDARHAVAKMLGLHETQLRQNRLQPDELAGAAELTIETAAELVVQPVKPPPSLLSAQLAPRRVPVFMDTDEIVPDRASEWTGCPEPLIGPVTGAFGVYVSRSRGRFRPGDLVFARPRMPPRAGDSVIVLQAESIEAIGDLIELGPGSATIQDGPGEPKTLQLDGVRLLKVAVAYFA